MNQFFIVGAQRSSTTWLYKMLAQHPQICMAEPVRPEPKYFLDKGYNDCEKNYLLKYFSNVDNDVLSCGEKSTTYIESELAAKRISTMFPDAKIIMMLRNPVERAISNYFFSVNNGLEKRGMQEVFLDKKEEPLISVELSTDPFNYLGRGVYKKYIDLYEKYFNKKNILILSTKNVTENLKSLSHIYDFLGVDYRYNPRNFFVTENASSMSNVKIPEDVVKYLNDYYSETFSYLSQYPGFND